VRAGTRISVQPRSLVVLQAHTDAEPEPDHSVAASLAALTNTQAIPVIAANAVKPEPR
jgi:glycogen operon protein